MHLGAGQSNDSSGSNQSNSSIEEKLYDDNVAYLEELQQKELAKICEKLGQYHPSSSEFKYWHNRHLVVLGWKDDGSSSDDSDNEVEMAEQEQTSQNTCKP